MLSDEQRWFDFNDLSVTPISYNEIEKKYSGGESAYMLFYRLQSDRTLTCKNDVIEEIPEYLINEINMENDKLQEDREAALYKHCVTAYHYKDFMYNDGLLIPIKEGINLEELAVVLQLDDREGIEGMKRKILDSFQHYDNDTYQDITKSNLYMARPFERYLHVYQIVDNNVDMKLLGISDNDIIFYSEDKVIEIMDINEHRPILLKCRITCDDIPSNKIFDIKVFSSMKLSTLYDLIVENIGFIKEDLCVMKNANIRLQVELLFLLQELKNSDETVENKNFASVEELYITDMLTMQEGKQLNTNHFYCIITNITRQSNQDRDTNEIIVVQTNLNVIVSEVKAIAASRFGVDDFQDCRLKAFDGTILRDYLNLRKCGLEGNQAALLLEKGQPITETSNILLTYDTPSNVTRGGNREIMIDHHSSVKNCISKMMQLSNLKEGNYHLMKSNLWFDSFAVINDLEKSLYQLHIEHGDHLILQEGQLLPEGFVKINIKIFVPLEERIDAFYNCDVSLTRCLLNDMQAEYLKSNYVILSTYVEIALDSVLQELKMQLLTLPEASQLSLSSINHLRIYHQRGNKCNLLKGDTKLIKNLNIEHRSTICMQALFLEETLSVDTTLLFIRHRISERREYGPAIEITCNFDDLRNSDSLKKKIRNILGTNSSQELIIAKYNQQQFEWMVINEVRQIKFGLLSVLK